MGLTSREKFEAAVIARLKESGYLEVEIRTECLGRSGEGYADGSVDAYWDFWQAAIASVEFKLPPAFPGPASFGRDVMSAFSVRDEVERLGLKVAP